VPVVLIFSVFSVRVGILQVRYLFHQFYQLLSVSWGRLTIALLTALTPRRVRLFLATEIVSN